MSKTPTKTGDTAGAAAETTAKPKYSTPALRIAAKRDGFRRCGVTFSADAADFAAGTFSPEEVERLHADAALVVVELGE